MTITEILSGLTSDPVLFDTDSGTWGFFDELWCDFYKGYSSEEDARKALQLYIKDHGL